jgi:hypothetical protein
MSNQSPNDLSIDRINANNTTIRIFLDFYMNLHTQTVRRIDSLYDILDEIRSAVNILGGISLQLNENDRNDRNYYRANYGNNERANYGNNERANYGNNERNNDRYQFNGERSNRGNGVSGGGRNGRSANAYGRSGRTSPWSDERRHSWHNQNNTQNYVDWLNNRIYIQGRPYRMEFENLQTFYSNVPVVATPAQIQTATRLTRFSNIINPINNSCPITLEPFVNESNVTEILGCNHLFNPDALSSWFRDNVRCPMCRYDIRTNRISSRQEEETREETKDETKEETEVEETKDDNRPVSQSTERSAERNSNPRRRILNRNTTRVDASGNILEAALTEITGALLNQFLTTASQSGTENGLFFNNIFDPSNNEFAFRGYRN